VRGADLLAIPVLFLNLPSAFWLNWSSRRRETLAILVLDGAVFMPNRKTNYLAARLVDPHAGTRAPSPLFQRPALLDYLVFGAYRQSGRLAQFDVGAACF
jgi:hypothetical protein